MKYELQHYKDAVAEPMPEYIRNRITVWGERCSVNGIDCNWVHIAYRNGDYKRIPVSVWAILEPNRVEREWNRVCAAAN